MCVIYAGRWMGTQIPMDDEFDFKGKIFICRSEKELLRHIQNALALFFTSKYLRRCSKKEGVVKMLVFGDMVHTEIKSSWK